MKEEMEAVAGAAGVRAPQAGEEPEPSADESADDAEQADCRSRTRRALGLMEFEQDRGLYTFHQTLLDHVARQPAMDPARALSGRLDLLAFHADCMRGPHRQRRGRRMVENVLSTLESASGLREKEGPLDPTICFVVDGLGGYFERRRLWRVGQYWLERAVTLHRSSTLARDQVALSQELQQLARFCTTAESTPRHRYSASRSP